MATPLLAHLLFHPRSQSGRALALALHRSLNDDASLPGLRVPTRIAREDGSELPPSFHTFDQAERNVFIVLADDLMAIEPGELPSGKVSWATFVGDIWEGCSKGRDRFLPIQLSEHAWPLEPRLDGTNAFRAWPLGASIEHAVVRRVVIETCRYLAGMERGSNAPIRLFLSHAKRDIAQEPKVFEAISKHLDATQPVRAWIDSAEIEAGSQFADAIEQGAKDSALLVLATRHYSSRPWCRRELLLAKQHGNPIVVVDALEGLDLRSFPYAGNVPELRWSEGGAERVVDLLLKETLRALHTRLALRAIANSDDVVLTNPPELATIVALPNGTAVLYPDPPIGDEEATHLKPLGHRLTTPLQRAGSQRALSQVRVAISTSECDDTARHGVFPEHRDAALIEITRQLLVRGATLHYGGHLGDEGYTQALFEMAQAYRELSGLAPAERVVNDVGWPLPLATLPPPKLAAYSKVARFRRVPRPAGVEALEPATFIEEPVYFPADSPARRFAWARGMTEMRRDQTARTQARIVLGGKIGPTESTGHDGEKIVRWYSGRIPGIVEEGWLSLQGGKPLYLLGGFGGAAALVGDLLQGFEREDFTWEYHAAAPHSEAMRDLYRQQGVPFEDYAEMQRLLARVGIAGLSRNNGLSVDENRELLGSRDVSRIVELVVKGTTSAIAG